ncbi:Hsp20 family protein [Colwellia sp. 1_MG-2023]|uniref:Hsp20 family protein n=1 Tax=Colwellia sp. 1_MG-2023 TaxID=3062649 RepID=UPI0026E2FE01|nr:Hsp20 family protein [Colwellia sp. 1_MG-2023]MDO6446240.1 Hsp20 family protein [Colwellia sp. 1_MG-2023]
MNSVDLTPLYRNSVGFDRFASMLDNALTSDASVSGYPPYDIEMIEDNRYAITLAVAGFSQDELDIQVEKGVLTVKGDKNTKEKPKYLYNGIANRTFERKFNLADYVEITNAELTNGLLTIDLVKEIPEAMKPKKIAINQQPNAIEHKTEEETKIAKTEKVA